MRQEEFINLTQDYSYWLKGKIYIDIPYILAMKKAAPLTIGKGIIFNGDQKNILDKLVEFYEKNKVYEKLFQNEVQLSLYGRSLLYILTTKTNDLTFRIAQPTQNARVAKVDELEQLAEIWSQPYATDSPFIERIQYTKNYVTVETFAVDNKKIAIGSLWSEVEDKLIPVKKKVYKNDIGIMPFIEMINLPFPNLYGNSTVKAIPDTLPVRKMIQDAQETIKIKRKERRLNRSRFVGKLADDILQGLGRNAANELINNDGYIESTNIGYSKENSSAGTGVVAGTPNMETYVKDLDSTLDLIYKGAGYTWDSFDNSQYTNKTESLMSNKNDMETTFIKQQLRLQQLYKLFDYVLLHYELWDGKGPRPYTMQFSNSLMVEKLKLIESNVVLLENQIISRSEFRSQVDDISLEQAKELIKQVDDEWAETQTLISENVNNENDDDNQDGNKLDNKEVL